MDSNLIYLVQTDTSVGFSSSNYENLSQIKRRNKKQKILQTLKSFKCLKEQARIPKKFKKKVRKSKYTTFIYPNLKAFRVINQTNNFYLFIKKFNMLYSTSANLTKQGFNQDFARQNSDIIVLSKKKFSSKNESKIFKLGKNKLSKIR